MLLILKPNADQDRIERELRARGMAYVPLAGPGSRVITLDAHTLLDEDALAALGEIPGVAEVVRAPSPHPLIDAGARISTVGAAGVRIGEGEAPVLIAGPCAVESRDQIEESAELVAAAGARVIRGGAFKPRTSPYSFQGLGEPALRWLREAADRHGLAVVTEAMADTDVSRVAEMADLIQVGSRTMHAYGLLKVVGRAGKPVLLKRGMAATIEEWLLAAEYLLDAGAASVVLCERGVRTFEPATRNTLDLCAVAYLLEHGRLPIVVDPSHASGRRELVPRLARAALAVGAHGVMVEVHPNPGDARSDADQALTPAAFAALAADLVRTPQATPAS